MNALCNQDQRKRVNGLDDLVHNVSAEAIKLPLDVLCKITKNFADEWKIGEGGFGIVYKVELSLGSNVQCNILFLTSKQNH